MIETLVATLIVTVAMLGSVGIFMTVSNLTARVSEDSAAQMLCRRGIEEAKNLGFANLAEGSTTRYYDQNCAGGSTTTSSTDRYRVTTTVSSNLFVDTSVSEKALRTVTVVVSLAPNGAEKGRSVTYLAWGGP
ncbi:hypothetical protein [Fimbriimonas ginsengisoli]|nr:hypothetical protein [Fimbriimonas ginsengisoli]